MKRHWDDAFMKLPYRAAWWAIVVFCPVVAGADPVASNDPPPLPPFSDFEDPLTPFVPKVGRTTEEDDRLEALALFASGRALEQKQDLAGALRRYQRAARLDPEALPVYQAIVQLAFGMGRTSEGVRYALKAAEIAPGDPEMMQRLAAHLASQGDTKGAIKLYEQVRDSLRDDPHTPEYVLLHAALSELYVDNDQAPEAAAAMAVIRDALADPEKFGLKGRAKRQLAGKDVAATQRRFGQVFLLAGRLEEAQAAFEEAQRTSPDPALYGYALAELDLRQGKADDGLAHLQAYLDAKEISRGVRPYELLAELLALGDKSAELVPRLEKTIAADPKNLVLAYFLAGKVLEAGNRPRAIELYRASLSERPTTDVFAALARLYREDRNAAALLELWKLCVEKAGDLRPLRDEVEAAAKDEALVDALVEEARRQQDAQQPDGLPLAGRLALAAVAIQAKRYPLADEYYALALAVAPADQVVEIYKDWGFSLVEAERFGEASNVYQQAIDKQAIPADRPDFHFMLAGPLEMQGKTDEALAAAREAIARTERHADKLGDMVFLIQPRLAWVNYHAKRYDAAKQCYEELIQKYDSVNTSAAARDVVRDARFALSNIELQMNDYPAAEEWLEQILDEYPDDVGAMNDLGYLWTEQNKNLRRALPMIQKAVEAQPENRAYRDSLGWVYYQLGRHEEAVAELERAVASPEPPDAVLYDHLGDAYFKVQRLEDARRAWQKSVELFDEQGESAKRQPVAEKLQRLDAPAAPAED